MRDTLQRIGRRLNASSQGAMHRPVPTGSKLRCPAVHPPFQVCLVEPEIPPNTGSIARTCAATQSVLHLVEPLGFSLDERALRRAGVDYWHLVDVRVHASFAAFDPTTIMDPADPTRVLNMGDLYPQYGHGLGCKREAYSGPVYYYNRSGPATFRTDAYGKLDPNGPIVQYVSLHDDLGVKMTTDGTQTQAKLQSHHCGKPGLKAPN